MKQVVFLFVFFFAAIFTCIAQEYQEVVDVNYFMKDIDFSMNFGTSYQIPNLSLGIHVRNSLVLTDLCKEIELGDESGKKPCISDWGFY